MAEPVTPRAAYRAEIDGLRAVSILCVLAYHLDLKALAPGGFIGVDVFFVISGYLITRLILADAAAQRFSFVQFYTRRALRILPALFVMLAAASLGALLLLTPKEAAKFVEQALHAAFQILNFHFAEKVGYFELDTPPSVLLHTWSLAVEEQFYLLWPLALVFLARPGGRWSPFALIAAVTLASFALSVATVGPFNRFAFYHLPPRAWELGLGALLATAPAAQAAERLFAPRRGLREAAAAFGLGLILASAAWLNAASPFPGWNAATPALGAALVIAATGAGATAVGAALGSRPAVALGLISYSLYLWHWPVVMLVKHYLALYTLPLGVAAAVGLGSVLLAALSWALVEQPARRSGLAPRGALIGLGAAAGVVCALAVGVGAAADAEWRFAPATAMHGAVFRLDARRVACLDSNEAPNYARFDACAEGPAAPNFEVLVYGDSHAAHYAAAVERWAAARNLTVKLVALGGCPPFFTDFEYYVRGVRQTRCNENARFVAPMALDNPHIRYVFFAMRFSSYYRRDDRFIDQYLLDAAMRDRSTAASRLAFERHMAETVRRTRAAGATPVILGEAPRLARDPRNCEERKRVLLRRLAPLADDAPCADLNTAFNAGVKALSDAAMRRAAAAGGGLYFDAAAHLTSGATADGVYLYVDEDHLTVDGAHHLAAHMRF